MYITNQI